MLVAQRVERDQSTGRDHLDPDPRVEEGDPVIDAEAYAHALGEIGPCGYGAVARYLGWGATRGGHAADVLRMAGRVVYDRTGRGRLVANKK